MSYMFSLIAFIIILPFWLVLGAFYPRLLDGFVEKCGIYKNGKAMVEYDKRSTLIPPTSYPPPQVGRKNNYFCNINGKMENEKKEAERQRGKEAKYSKDTAPLNIYASKHPCLLFYGISVGEVTAMESLIKKTREIYPDVTIIVMTGTKTGQEIAQKKLGETADLITYFPFDFAFCIDNMLKKLKPDAIFIMETELWPNFAHITNKKKIPTYIINARISDNTYKSYKNFKWIFAQTLKKYKYIYPQSKQDYDKFISLGANPDTTQVMGNLKFDIKASDTSQLNFSKNPNHKILLAGSTHAGEEEIVSDVFIELKKDIPELKLIIAPRHNDRNEKVFELIKKTGFDCAKSSETNGFYPPPKSGRPPLAKHSQDVLFGRVQGRGNACPLALLPSCLLLDTMGELAKFYSICDIAFIGGSFPSNKGDNKGGKGIGGHNPLEATIFNKPVVSGPSIHNFKDIYAILTSTSCAKIVKTTQELKEEIKKLLTNENLYQKASQDCEEVFEQNKGAVDFVLNVIKTLA